MANDRRERQQQKKTVQFNIKSNVERLKKQRQAEKAKEAKQLEADADQDHGAGGEDLAAEEQKERRQSSRLQKRVGTDG